ncbi:MAG TPA: ABC transporter permease [Vicinamibacterales bacterium]|nr:ABC transporter permease [Vicinamibacterales bacterium]
MQDVRYAFRTFRKQPVFTAVAVLTLTLGIGANTAIFSLVYQILLRPLPYADAERLVFVWNTYPLMGLAKASVSIPDYIDRRTQADAIEEATLFTGRALNLADGGQAEQVRGLAVTPSFFSTLGRQPALGRAFTEDEAKPGADRQAILSHGLWRSRFGGDRSIVGRDIRMNGESYKVVGVLPADLELPGRDIGALVPFAFTAQQMSDAGRGNEFSQMIARLRPGATIELATSQMKMIVDRNLQRLPQSADFVKTSGFTGFARPIREELVGDTREPLIVLQLGVLFVLFIACANVANLLLMRATGRGRELAIRTTLGAGHWRLVRQMLTEGIVLSLMGGIAGLAVGFAGVRALIALTTAQIPGATDATLHLPVMAFTLGLAILTGLVFGIVPAIAVIRGNTNTLLKEDATRGSAGRGTGVTRAALVIGETAVALMLLVGAGLLIKSFARLQQVDPGFERENVLTAQLSLPATRYATPADRAAFWSRLLEKAQQIPGVTSAGMTSNVPFNGNISSGSYSIVGYTPEPGEARPHARQEIAGGDYFRTMQIPLIEGRLFNAGDTLDSSQVAVVDQYLVDRYFKGRSAVGQEIQRGGPTSPKIRIVGVVGTINSIDLGQPVTKERIYRPVTQQPGGGGALVLKTALEPSLLVSQVRTAVQQIDPEQPIFDVRTMEEWVDRSLEIRRAPTMLLTIFGAVALLLSAIGIYGVLAYGVSQRVREFGIRQALGADQRSILSLVLVQGMLRVALGIAIGLAGALMLSKYLESQLFGVGARDVPVFAAVTVVLFGVAILACYLPARRATRIDPMVALRDV